MHMATKGDIFKEHLKEWLSCRGDRKKRGEIIRHIVFVAKVHPNSVSRSFKRLQLRDPCRAEGRGRRTYYTPDVTAALRDAWEVGDRCCGELLHPQIGEYLDILIRDGQWTHSDEATAKLRAMSEHTVRRRIAAFRKKEGVHAGTSTTRPSALKSIIPIFKGPWTDLPPGHLQIDTVAHCGETLLGDYAYTLSAIDACTYWIGLAAQWQKGQSATLAPIERIERQLPVPLRGLHPDSGGEFVNWHCKRWCDAHVPPVVLSRSEPGRKNDNMYVEERNGHVVRTYLGYRRFDCPKTVPLLGELYTVLCQYLNHFKAVRRQVSKERIGAKYVRKYEKTARTPYARMLARDDVSAEVKETLRAAHETLNPLFLLSAVDRLRTRVHNQQARHDDKQCGCSFR